MLPCRLVCVTDVDEALDGRRDVDDDAVTGVAAVIALGIGVLAGHYGAGLPEPARLDALALAACACFGGALGWFAAWPVLAWLVKAVARKIGGVT